MPQLLAQHPGRVVAAVRPDVGGPGQPAHRLLVVGLGQRVGALEPLQLQPVLEQPQKFVGGGEVGRVLAPDVAALPQRGQRVDRRGHVQRLVAAAVHQLQELHREFDVAQPAAAQLDLAAADVGGHQLLDAPAHRLHLDHEVLAFAGHPHHRHQRVQVASAELRVAHGRTGFQQRLELPRLGPALVVGDVRLHGADQLAAAAFRSQPGVDLEERLGRQPHHLAGHPGGDGVGALADEDDVDVADVVQFAGTAFAHRDDRQPRRCPVAAHVVLGHPQRGGQCRVGQVRQVGGHHGERQHRFVLDGGGQVERGQHQQPVPVQGAQPHHRRAGVGQRLVDAAGEHRAQLVVGGQRDVAAQQFPGSRLGDQVVAQGQRGAEHREQPSPQRAFGEQGGAQFVPPGVGRLGQPDQGEQRGVGVRRPGQRPQQIDVGLVVMVVPTQLRHPFGRLGIDQPEPADAGQPGALRRGFGHDHDGSATRRRAGAPGTGNALRRRGYSDR
ncbi:hypothetical protein PICSAR61_04298 [Mycobacterium avium subsp. paratuberculosis]|nr:hypothetical protein PICSAR61_04298 [Mycobacterium avium subsp. paratuberculosis]